MKRVARRDVAGPEQLSHVVQRQLTGLIAWSALPARVAQQLAQIFPILTEGAMQRAARGPFGGLSQINASGLPFQWSFSFAADGVRSVRFLCEPGQPGTRSLHRLAHARDCLARALACLHVPQPAWLDQSVFAHLLPRPQSWPEHWRSALWFGVGASAAGVLIKPYVNLNWGTPLERWRRVGKLLHALDRPQALAQLCALSGQVSRDSWPVGLAVDVRPDGSCGRVKIYFRSGAVGTAWLQRWYAATGAELHAPAMRAMLDAFAFCGQGRYPEQSFIVGLELHGEDMSLKTDLGITRWMEHDAGIGAGIRRMLRRLDCDSAAFDDALHSVDAWPLSDSECRCLRFVGLGHEPDGSQHLNVYLEPPLPGAPTLAPRKPVRTAHVAVQEGLEFLRERQQHGLWQDYALPVGVADQWITAYVLWLLADLAPVFATAWLARQLRQSVDCLHSLGQAAGGWGYNATTPIDADSSSLATLALRAHGLHADPRALDFLAACQHADGSVATYLPGTAPGGSWCAGVCDITAVAALALGGQRGKAALAFLARARRPDGSWPSFWWHSPWYGRFVAQRANPAWRATLPIPSDTANAFESALQLLCCPATPALAQRLLEQQQADGGWPSSALLRLVDTGVHAPTEVIAAGPSYVDQRRIFTSVTAVAALAQAQQML